MFEIRNRLFGMSSLLCRSEVYGYEFEINNSIFLDRVGILPSRVLSFFFFFRFLYCGFFEVRFV